MAGALQISPNGQNRPAIDLRSASRSNIRIRPEILSKTHLSVGQSGGLLQRTGGVLELLELLQLHEASSALGSARLGGNVIALEQLLVLGLEERVTGRRLGEDEEGHFGGCWTLARTCGRTGRGIK